MYVIKFENTIIYLTGDPDYAAYDVKLSLEANKAGELSFTIPKSRNVSIPKLQPYVYVYQDSTMLWRGRVITTDLDFYENTVYTAEGMLAVFNDTLISPYVHQGTVEDLFRKVLNEHNSQVCRYEINASPTWQENKWYYLDNGNYVLIGTQSEFNQKISAQAQIFEITDNSKVIKIGTISSGFDPNNYVYCYWEKHTSSWEVLKTRLLDVYGGYFKIRNESDGTYLDYLNQTDITAESTQKIMLGENLTDLTKFIDATSLYTACIPVGAEIMNRTWNKWDYATGNPTWEDAHWYTSQNIEDRLEGSSGKATFDSYVANQTDLYTIESEEGTGNYVSIESETDSQRNPPKYTGQKYLLATQTLLDSYGIVYAPISETTWDDVTLSSNLLTKAKNYIDNQAVMLSNTIDITFADLSKIIKSQTGTGAIAGIAVAGKAVVGRTVDEESYDEIKLYKKVRVVSAYHGLDAWYIVQKVTYNLDAPETSSITIGETTLSLTDSTVKKDREIETISGEIKVIKEEKADVEKVEREIRIVEKTITETEESLEVKINAVNTRAGNIETRTSAIEQRADAIDIEISRESSVEGSVGWVTQQINTNFKFDEDGLTIGKSDDPASMTLSNEDLTFSINGVAVAKFDTHHMEVRNVEVDNQVGYNEKWVTRLNPNGNLNDMWVGG